MSAGAMRLAEVGEVAGVVGSVSRSARAAESWELHDLACQPKCSHVVARRRGHTRSSHAVLLSEGAAKRGADCFHRWAVARPHANAHSCSLIAIRKIRTLLQVDRTPMLGEASCFGVERNFNFHILRLLRILLVSTRVPPSCAFLLVPNESKEPPAHSAML